MLICAYDGGDVHVERKLVDRFHEGFPMLRFYLLWQGVAFRNWRGSVWGTQLFAALRC